ncbi:unnamed protein product [Urochloa decumbens]|uniref:DUF1618 domain-containing protein n=1 Tax=Urochloa decumbens TaxID=240449 RepID=A0ABC9GYA4_9POAL
MRKYRSRSPSPSPPRTRRKTHLTAAAAAAPMNTDAMHPPSGSPATVAPASASYPPWVLLQNRCVMEAVSSNSTGDAKTVAASRTTAGDPIRVSVRAAAPPAASSICVEASSRSYARILAAHGDSVLLTVGFRGCDAHPDYFIYTAGAAAAAVPPSLFLLPPCYHVDKRPPGYRSYSGRRGPEQRYLDSHAAGLVSRGNEDFVVALLINMVVMADNDGLEDDDGSKVKRHVAELLRLRDGAWSVTRVAIGDGEASNKDREELRLSSWQPQSVISVGGDGLLCFVRFGHGLMFTNVFDETPVFRHVPFPPAYEDVDRPPNCRGSSQDVCATSDGTAKLVSVYPRCCCGSSGATHCQHSSNAYTIKTWTLNMEDMVWVMDGMVDATELWALDTYKCLPRIQLANPIVSLDEPHVIFFMVCEWFYKKKDADETEWFILVDMKSKTIRSVYRYGRQSFLNGVLPSSVSHYFNSSPSCRDDAASSVSTRRMDSEVPTLGIANQQLTDNTRNSKAASPEETILAVLQEVPGLSREEVLKAYSIISQDSSGRRFRSLLGLPLNMRKDWLLMEIKSCEACSFCCICTANSQCD